MLGADVTQTTLAEFLQPLDEEGKQALLAYVYKPNEGHQAREYVLIAMREQKGFRQTARLVLSMLDQVCQQRGWSTAFLDNFLAEIDSGPRV